MQDKLILLKPRWFRVSETIVVPLILMPIGPTLRALTGGTGSVMIGLAVYFVLLFAWSGLSRWLAPHLGGAWLSRGDYLQRCLDETASVGRWSLAALQAAAAALTLVSVLLIVQPLDGFVGSTGGFLAILALIAVPSGVVASRALARSRLAGQVTLVDGPPPQNRPDPDLRRILPRTYLAWTVGMAAGAAAAWLIGGEIATAATFLVVGEMLRRWLLRERAPRVIYRQASVPGLRRQMLLGMAFYGVPMGIFFSGQMLLDLAPRVRGGTRLGLEIAMLAGSVVAMLLVSLLLGLAFGAFMAGIRRLNLRSRQSEG